MLFILHTLVLYVPRAAVYSVLILHTQDFSVKTSTGAGQAAHHETMTGKRHRYNNLKQR